MKRSKQQHELELVDRYDTTTIIYYSTELFQQNVT